VLLLIQLMATRRLDNVLQLNPTLPRMRVEAVGTESAASLKDTRNLFACSSFFFLAMGKVAIASLATILQPELA